MNTPSFTEAQLMAFADSELPPAEARRIRAAALGDPALAARIAAYGPTGRALGSSFNATLSEAVPERLLAALQEPAPARVTALPVRKSALLRQAWPWALAASAAMAAVLLTQGPAPIPAAPILAGLPPDAAALADVLETRPSGEVARIQLAGRDYEVLTLATLREADGRYCREFTASDLSGGAEAQGLACRRSASDWPLEIASAAARGDSAASAHYQPASGSGPDAPGLTRLDAAAERALLAKGWAP